jgi:NAD(P)H-dependent FMN reductase
MPKILAFSGSARKSSINQKMVAIAAQGARIAGAEVTLINLADYSMPIFNEDLESTDGMPESAKEFKQLLIDHDGFLIASPEYNSAFSPLLKNAIDWATRPFGPDIKSAPPFAEKYATIMAASPGALGGLRGLVFLRLLLSNIAVTVLPAQLAVPNASDAFAEDGSLNNKQMQEKVMGLGKALAQELLKK